ncbi:MAG: hypothetical protein H8D38_05885 [DPANN group archaeon]|nr:hypothetical protein [DPANN group archaeon]
MGEFDQAEFKRFVLESGVVGIFPKEKQLKSKRMSNWYVNWRDVTNDPALLYILAEYVINFATDKGIAGKIFYGVPEGATKIGVAMNHILGQEILKAPGQMLDSIELSDIAEDIIEQTGRLNPNCYIGYPADTPAKELALLTQHVLSTKNKFASEKLIMPMFRQVTKTHGDEKDQHSYVGKPEGRTVLVINGPWAKENNFEDLFGITGTEIVGIVYTDIAEGVIEKKYAPDDVEVFYADGGTLILNNPSGVVEVEDVTTTGGSAIKKAYELRQADIKVEGVIGVTNRTELTPIPGLDDPEVVAAFKKIYQHATGLEYIGAMGVSDAFDHMGIPYHAMITAPEFLPEAVKASDKCPELVKAIEREFKTYGLQSLKLGVE